MDLKSASNNGQPPQAPLIEPAPPKPVLTEDPFKPDAPVGKAPRSRQSRGLLKKLVKLVVILALLGGTGYGVYYWQHQKVTSLQNQLNQTATKATAAPTSTTPAYATNIGVGYPLSIPTKKVTLSLSLPAGNNIVQMEPSTGSQNALVAYYTESANDIVARWLFNTTGTSKNPSGSLDNFNDLTITELKAWLAANDEKGVTYPDGTTSMTTAQKTKFLADLKAQTTACVKDATKGFVTDDKVFNICYTLVSPKAQGANWTMTLSGYGEPDGTSLYLRGVISLPDSATDYKPVADSYIQSLKLLTTVVSAK